MFSSLGEKISAVFKKLSGNSVIAEQHITVACREIKVALIEADVSFDIVKLFIESIKEKALGKEVLNSITPVQAIIKIVQDELITILGSDASSLNFNSAPPSVIMMCGLQGAGKTTTSNKIAHYIKNTQNKKILMASLDVYRPAAQLQLARLGSEHNIDTLPIIENETAISIAIRACKKAQEGYDILILDTAGRTHIDDTMMQELQDIKATTNPNEIILVLDSLTGQDAINIARSFHEAIKVTGAILTRTDADSRGGAALSLRMSLGVAIKFIGTGEKVEDLELFDPKRVASRILDMGDIVSLVEAAERHVDSKAAEESLSKISSGKFDLSDYIKQIDQIKNMGGLSRILSMLPGMGAINKTLKEKMISDDVFIKHKAIVYSMTLTERSNWDIIKAKRKLRIANGSGTSVQEVNKLLKQFSMMRKMMSGLSQSGNIGQSMQKMMPPFNL